jgi:acyl dehydratase
VELAPRELTVDEAFQRPYLEALEDFHRRYLAGSGRRPALVHPGVLLNQTNWTRSPSFTHPEQDRGLHAKDDVRFMGPAYIGEPLRVTWHEALPFERNGKLFRVYEIRAVDKDGMPILERREIEMIQQPSVAGGRRPTRSAPAEQETARREQPAVPPARAESKSMRELHGSTKHVTLQRMRLFSGWPQSNLHTDPEQAKSRGFAAPIASATQTMGYLCQLLLEEFGTSWLSGGTLKLSFIKPVYAGDELTTHAELIENSQEDPLSKTRYRFRVWVTNQAGAMTTVGEAGALADS